MLPTPTAAATTTATATTTTTPSSTSITIKTNHQRFNHKIAQLHALPSLSRINLVTFRDIIAQGGASASLKLAQV